MTEIVIKGGPAASGIYHRTPLDFISREEWHWSLYWTHWINILRKMHINFAPKSLPHDRLENTVWLDIKARGALPAFILTSLLYSLLGYISCRLERSLPYANRADVVAGVESVNDDSRCFVFIITAFAYIVCPAIQRYFKRLRPPIIEPQVIENYPHTSSSKDTSRTDSNIASQSGPEVIHVQSNARPEKKNRSWLSTVAARLRNNSVSKDPMLDVPLKATIPMYGAAFLYCTSRTLIIILDIIQLRSMPVSAYTTVDWGSFVPHLS